MARKIFISEEHQREFDQRGHFVYQAFSENDIAAIRHFYSLKDPGINKDFYSSIESEDAAYRIEVDTFLKSYFTPLIDILMDRYLSLAATFIVKRGANSTIYDHTDDCLVDESEHTSVNMWSPLVDTGTLNGAIRVLPGSHRIPNVQRGFGIPYRFESFKEIYADKMILCPMKAGQILVYDPRLIHNSYPNLSGLDRPAIITGTIPQEATPIANFPLSRPA